MPTAADILASFRSGVAASMGEAARIAGVGVGDTYDALSAPVRMGAQYVGDRLAGGNAASGVEAMTHALADRSGNAAGQRYGAAVQQGAGRMLGVDPNADHYVANAIGQTATDALLATQLLRGGRGRTSPSPSEPVATPMPTPTPVEAPAPVLTAYPRPASPTVLVGGRPVAAGSSGEFPYAAPQTIAPESSPAVRNVGRIATPDAPLMINSDTGMPYANQAIGTQGYVPPRTLRDVWTDYQQAVRDLEAAHREADAYRTNALGITVHPNERWDARTLTAANLESERTALPVRTLNERQVDAVYQEARRRTLAAQQRVDQLERELSTVSGGHEPLPMSMGGNRGVAP